MFKKNSQIRSFAVMFFVDNRKCRGTIAAGQGSSFYLLRKNTMRRIFPALLCVIVLAPAAMCAAGEMVVESAFDANGLSGLKVGGVQILQASGARVFAASFRKGDDKTPLEDRAAKAKDILQPGDMKVVEASFDAAARKFKTRYAWGAMEVEYKSTATSLDMKVTLTNTTPDFLDQWTISLLNLNLPEEPNWPLISEALYFGQPVPARSANSINAPLVVAGGTSQFWFVGCCGEANRPLTLSLSPGGKGKEAQCGLNVQAGGDKCVYEDIYDTRPIAPGQSDSFTVSLRFAPRTTDPVKAAADVCQTYAASHPLLLNWPDRRPIVRSFIGDWLPQRTDPPSMDVPKAEANADFRKKVLQAADGLLATIKAADAQGFILWNVEGGPGSIKYVGDPHMVDILCPEMSAVADEFFKKFIDANVRPGLCLRPSHIEVRPDASGHPQYVHTHTPGENPVEVLCGKISYARKRWGCTIFYIDTNCVYRKRGSDEKVTSALMSAEQWDQICARNPGVLLVPEHSYIRYYTSSAGYDQQDMGCTVSPPIVKQTWPGAFKCVTIDVPALRGWDTLVRMCQGGDVILFDGGDQNIRNVTNARIEAAYLNGPLPQACQTSDPNKLLPLLDGNDARIRFFASKALGGIKSSATYEKMLSLTADEDWLVRKNAVVALGLQGDANAAATLLSVMSDANANVEALGVKAFAAIGPPAVAPLVVSLGKTAKTNAAALQALAAIGTEEALKAVIATTADAAYNINVRALALRLMCEKAQRVKPDALVLDCVLRALDDKDLRNSVTGYLPRIRDPKVLPAIDAALAKEKAADKPDSKFIARLEQTLKEMGRK